MIIVSVSRLFKAERHVASLTWGGAPLAPSYSLLPFQGKTGSSPMIEHSEPATGQANSEVACPQFGCDFPEVMSTAAGEIRIRVAAIIQRGESILLVRHEKDGRSYWMLPGGGVDVGERLDTALVRELREEVGIEIHPGRLVLVNDSIAPDHHRHILNLYFTADIVRGEPVLGNDARVVEVAFQPVTGLVQLVMYPDFAAELSRALESKFQEQPSYLGNYWA